MAARASQPARPDGAFEILVAATEQALRVVDGVDQDCYIGTLLRFLDEKQQFIPDFW